MLRMSLVAALALAASCTREPAPAAPTEPLRLEPAWTLEGFAHPESVALGADGTTLYVTNVGGEGGDKDGNGVIARVSLDGAMLERDWATGLDGPKGMAIKGDRLFVTDIDRIVELDAASGRVIARHAAEGAGFLNDAALLSDGTVLASDSDRARIYALKDGVVTTWLEHELLGSINGLLPEGDHMIVSTMAGRLLSVDLASKEIRVLAESLGDADGIAALGNGEYLVSEWPGRLFRVDAQGGVRVLMDTRETPIFMNDFLLVNDLLLIPNWEPGTLSAFRVVR